MKRVIFCSLFLVVLLRVSEQNEIGLDRASIVKKLKPTAAILE